MGLIWPNWSETEELLLIRQQTVETGLPLSTGSGLEETSAGEFSGSYLEKPVPLDPSKCERCSSSPGCPWRTLQSGSV